VSAAFVQDEFLVLVLVNESECRVLRDALSDYYTKNRVYLHDAAVIARGIADRVSEAEQYGSAP